MVGDLVVPWMLAATCAVIVPLIILFVVLCIVNESKKLGVGGEYLPPGPKKVPIIGNLHQMSLPAFRCFADLAKQYGPLMHMKMGEVDAVVVSSPEIAKQVLKDMDPVFADRPESIALKIFWYNYIDMAFCPYGEYWRQMRKICIVELLSTKSVRSLSSIRKDEVSRLVESLRLSAGDPVNLTDKVVSVTSSVTCRAAFGKVCKDKDSLIKLVKQGHGLAAGFSIADIFPSSRIAGALSWGTKLKLMRMRRKMDVILDDIIREHETNYKHSGKRGNGEFGNEDLVDVLLRVKESGDLQFPIGYDNIKAVLFDMFSGGTETSASTLDWAMTELMRNPQVMARAQAEVRQVMMNGASIEEEDILKLNYVKMVVMETLRLHPQASIIGRTSRERSQLSGYDIPEKVKVLVNVWAIQRDPRNWDDPETFQPERFQNQPSLEFTGSDARYLPFGSGKRMCPGIAFGFASVVLPLAQLLYNFDWKLPSGVHARSLDMMESSGLAAFRKEKLFVVATPYI